MKILMVCQHYWPEHFQITEICEELAARGHEVTALVGIPNYPDGVVPDDYLCGKNRRQTVNGVKIIRCEEIPRSEGIVGLAKNYFSYMISANKKLKDIDGNFDVVFAYQLSPVLMAVPAIKAKSYFKIPVLLYCADIWPDAVMAMLPHKLSFVMPLVKKISTHIYAAADFIATNSSAYVDCFKQVHGIQEERLAYVPQFADDAYLDMDLSACPSKKTRFMVMGNIGKLQDMSGMLKAVNRIKSRNDFELHIVGTGSVIEWCKKFVSNNSLETHVFFHGRHPFEEMPDFYRKTDCCLLTLNVVSAPWISSTLPSRLQGYMAAGKPILGAISGSAAEVIAGAGCGRTVAAGDDRGLAALMEDFLDNKNSYSDCGENGRLYFRKHFMKKRYMDKIEDLLQQLVEGGSKS